MPQEFYDRREIMKLLQDVFFDTVRDIIVADYQDETHPASTVAAISGIRRFIDDVKRRLDENASGD
jgi:hypothetical protein